MPTLESYTFARRTSRHKNQSLQRVCLSQRITDRQLNGRKEEQTANTGLENVVVQCSADTFVVSQSLVLGINICGVNRHLR